MEVWGVGAAQPPEGDIVLGPLSPNGVLLEKRVKNFSSPAVHFKGPIPHEMQHAFEKLDCLDQFKRVVSKCA